MDGCAAFYGVERQAVQSRHLRRHTAGWWAYEHQRRGRRGVSADGGEEYTAAAGYGALRSAREPGSACDGAGADAWDRGDLQSDQPRELLGNYAAGVSGGDGDER